MTASSNGRARRLALAAVAAAGLGLTACATAPAPYQYSQYEAGRPARVEEGDIVSIRPVRLGGGTSGVGAATGAVAGGLIGNNNIGRGRRWEGNTGGTLVGAVAGALIGNAIEKSASNSPGFAYTVRTRRGNLVEVAQADAQPIPVGTHVFISYGERVRIEPAQGAYGPPPPAPPFAPR